MDKNRLSLRTNLYKKMYLIRRAEQGIINYYATDAMKTPMHMSMGEEAAVVGVCTALKKTDQVLGTYRSHALYLAKTGDAKKFFAEMYGKATGIADGKVGSMHLSSPEHGHLVSSAIVAAAVPVAMGVAYANQYQKTGAMTTVFFGDGALEEGVFWESLNFASLKKLPLLFVCEDNGFAIQTDLATRHGYASINKIVAQFDCLSFESASTDAEKIYDLTAKVMAEMRSKRKPAFLRLEYYRYLEHCGVKQDFYYRPKAEFDRWFRRDPVLLMRKKLLASGMGEGRVKVIEKTIDAGVEGAIRAAEKAPFPAKEKLYANVFYEE